jgi:ABC-2 type transport system permease protein
VPERLRRIVYNPLIVKDGLSRMRTWRAPAVIGLYLGLLGLFAFSILAPQLATPRRGLALAQIGSNVFTALALIQLALVSLFAPGVAAGAISGERERQTLDVLMVSCVTPLRLVWGKLVASVAFILLLIVASLPLFATVFFFGGIDLEQFLVAQILTVTTALALGAASIFWSALCRRTLVSTVAAYGFAFAITYGTFVLGTLLTQLSYVRSQPVIPGAAPPPHPLLLFNPFMAMLSLLQPTAMPMFPGNMLIQPWQATLSSELALVVLSIFCAVLLVRGRRPLRLARPVVLRKASRA